MAQEQKEPIAVRAYAGGRGEQCPRELLHGDRWVVVQEVHRTWREPEGVYFALRGEDDREYLLLCREPDLSWWLVS